MNEDDVYCSSCGQIIKSEAEICPHCGVRQKQNISQKSYGSDLKIYELQKLAEKSTGWAIIFSIFITPLGYIYIGKWGLAVINFLTLNYLLFGVIIVPIHTYLMISNARKELNIMGIDY